MSVAQQTIKKAGPSGAPVADRPLVFDGDDDLVRLSVERLLRSSNHGSVHDMRFVVEDGVVLLFGTLASYHLKQVIQTEVMKLNLVTRVENHCRVEPVVRR